MIKSFLILLSFSTLVFSSQQIILVVANDFNSSKASLRCFEDGKIVYDKIRVNIGRNGLGWGLGKFILFHKPTEPLKKEGDGKAPAGIFKLTKIFGYSQKSDYKLPYLYADKNLICVDDTHSKFYNQIIPAKGDEKSFEYMRRNDTQYQFGVLVQHNKKGIADKGSCIFIHIQKAENAPTAGCTSMAKKDLKKIVKWLDKRKNPLLIQVPQKYLKEVYKLYPQLTLPL